MTTELDALIDRIRDQLAKEKRSRPTAVEAELVGRVALRREGNEIQEQRRALAPGLRQAAAALPCRPVCRQRRSSAGCRQPRVAADDGGLAPASAAWRSVASLDDELKERLQQVRVLKKDVTDHVARAVKTLCNIVLGGLKTRYPRSFNWRLANSGSYFDKTKVASSERLCQVWYIELG